jgi:hypothetical protein
VGLDANDFSAIGSVASAVTALGALGIAIAAWRAASNSAEATEALTRIEADRRHAELRPQLRVIAEADVLSSDQTEKILYVELVGPPALEFLDGIDLKILPLEVPVPDEDRWEENWPYLFKPDAKDTPTVPYSREEHIEKIRVSQRRGRYMATPPEDDWLIGVADDTVEVELTCRREPFKPWVTTTTVAVPSSDEKGRDADDDHSS